MKLDQFHAYSWPPHNPDADRRALMSAKDIRDGQLYIPHSELVDSVNIALVLGRPLLVTGRPGTGKTRLASSIAWQLGLAGPFKYVAKSTSVARDLFYTYDALGRFHDAQIGAGKSHPELGRLRSPLEFVEYAALGKAILGAHAIADVADFLPEPGDAPTRSRGYRHAGSPHRSVVVIDEIDKAPRDFPNDLLDELDNLQFRIPEVHPDRATPSIAQEMKPLIVITTNEERQLPDAFLRRCVFFPIPFPGRRSMTQKAIGYTIEDIVEQHLGLRLQGGETDGLFFSAIGLFDHLRQSRDLQKPPGTAELLDWIDVLARIGADRTKDLSVQPEIFKRTQAALLKTEADRTRAPEIFSTWLRARGPARVVA